MLFEEKIMNAWQNLSYAIQFHFEYQYSSEKMPIQLLAKPS